MNDSSSAESANNSTAPLSADLEPKEGSSAYYSLLFTDTAARARALNTLQLIKVISTTLHEVAEPQVAEKKIHWWHEELARMAKREARHPACIAVQEHINSKDAVNTCLSILSAAANERFSPLATESDLREMIIADYGARLKLVELALTGSLPSYAHDATALGLGLTHRLATLTERLGHGYTVFSDDQYAQFKLSVEDMLADESKANVLIAPAIDQARLTLVQALDEELGNGKTKARASLPVHTMTRLRHSQTKLWQKRKPNLLKEYVTVTPVRKFIIAYGCKRKFA